METALGERTKADFQEFYQALGVDLAPYGHPNRTATCFVAPEEHTNGDRRRSTSVNLTNGLWHCHGCKRAGNAYQAALACGRTNEEARELLELFGIDASSQRTRPEAVYDYVDEEGRLLYQVVRFPHKQFRQGSIDPTTGEWRWSIQGVRRVPYRLPELLRAIDRRETVYIVEGEKDADAIADEGAAATTNSGGAGRWENGFASFFSGAHVVIVADRDEQGFAHAKAVRASIEGGAGRIDVVAAREGKDASDHLAAGFGLDDFRPLELDDSPTEPDPPMESIDEAAQPRLAERLVALARESGLVLFHDNDGRAYGSVGVDGHWENWPLASQAFERYLRWLFYEQTGAAPSANALKDTLQTLEAQALFAGPCEPVYLRLAGDENAIHLDLGSADWATVSITRSGWTLTGSAPVRFRRSGGMGALPKPVPGGSLESLRGFLNLAAESDWKLVVAWLLAAFRPPGQPYPVLVLHGEQGSAKSTTARVLRELLDPNSASLRAAPKDPRDLMVAANSSWILSFDNLSSIPAWFSDALCRISTGGGFATRQLYTDDQERIFDVQRPVILNGIQELATRSDLLDRSLLVNLPTITADKRRDERAFWASFAQAQPAVLGAVLDVVAEALASVESVELAERPRMADFVVWVTAAERALGWEPGSFAAVYAENRSDADQLALEASPIGALLIDIAREGFKGNATELLHKLNNRAEDEDKRAPGWPKTSTYLGIEVRRLAPNLRNVGLEVQFDRTAHKREIHLAGPDSVTSVTAVTDGSSRSLRNDTDDSNDSERRKLRRSPTF